jgi:hypothetical protein
MEALKKHLQQAQTMEEFLSICSQYYDFRNAKLGLIGRATLISQIDKVIAISGAKPKNK